MDKPRTLFWDLEVLPDMKEVLKVFPRISDFPGRTLRGDLCSVCCFSYQWSDEDEVKLINAWDFPNWEKDVNDDSAILYVAYPIIASAEHWVYHNGDRFDKKIVNTRQVLRNQPALPDVLATDTMKVAKKNLSMFSNSLGHLNKRLGLAEKMENGGWELWVKTWFRELEAMKTMEEYAKQDIVALKALYERFRPMDNKTPNANLWSVDAVPRCPKCGSYHLIKFGTRFKANVKYQQYSCKNCGYYPMEPLGKKTLR